jgi:hypothetical protein
MSKIILFANTDWYLYNFRLSLAKELRAEGHEVILKTTNFPGFPFRFQGRASTHSMNCSPSGS